MPFGTRCLALALVLLGAVAPSASADFQPLASPGAEIAGFAANGADLAALVNRAGLVGTSGTHAVAARVSHDGGATWTDAALPGGAAVVGAGLRRGPDGAFWTAVAAAGAPAAIVRMARGA